MIHNLSFGQHLKVSRGYYFHHGLYLWLCEDIRWVAELAKPQFGGTVRLVSWAEFAGADPVQLVAHANQLSPDQILRNLQIARQWRYNLLRRNCEHFATWCATGEYKSDQLAGVATAIASVTLLALGLSVVSA